MLVPELAAHWVQRPPALPVLQVLSPLALGMSPAPLFQALPELLDRLHRALLMWLAQPFRASRALLELLLPVLALRRLALSPLRRRLAQLLKMQRVQPLRALLTRPKLRGPVWLPKRVPWQLVPKRPPQPALPSWRLPVLVQPLLSALLRPLVPLMIC
jgi:hypothetical protein